MRKELGRGSKEIKNVRVDEWRDKYFFFKKEIENIKIRITNCLHINSAKLYMDRATDLYEQLTKLEDRKGSSMAAVTSIKQSLLLNTQRVCNMA